MKRLLLFATFLVLSLIGSTLLLAQSTEKDPFVGRWRLDRSKSTWVNMHRPENDIVMTVERQGDAQKWIFEGMTGDDSQRNLFVTYSFVIDWDGSKSSPIADTGAPNGEDTVRFSRVDENTVTSTGTKAGKVVETTKMAASNDDKVITMTSEGTNEQGKPTSSTTVWTKQ